jgi:hypothetical protein
VVGDLWLVEVDARNLHQVVYEVYRLRRHNLQVSLRELHPWVSQDFLGARSFFRVFVEYFGEQLFDLAREVVRQRELLVANVIIEFLVVLPFKWESAAQ